MFRASADGYGPLIPDDRHSMKRTIPLLITAFGGIVLVLLGFKLLLA